MDRRNASLLIEKGRYRARLAQCAQDLARAQTLRHLAFHGREGRDADAFDVLSSHILVEDMCSGVLVGCCRFQPLDAGAISQSYAAQYYELSGLERFDGTLVELGRFCVAPGRGDPDILRLAWAMLTRYVDENDVKMLFGCASFSGTDATRYRDAFAMLRERHLAPDRWRPRVKAPQVVRFDAGPWAKVDTKRALLAMPPLLRSYLMMGGWVSDHAVVDRQMNTLHVFTGLEIAAIPPARKRLLRADAA
ncbi:GNAT family N-acetyltransferase [Rhodalgimonas zhirmunskyi]|uniref:L-ornithine N(alpha)-acyltransferase n=1 Tax=Rhodalgimonas zhirmunskyi TaxID=2964767 RepID=A0AAJ1UBX4_9RHOB|nr:GNAT family N-acyltransferase [Rhodoalgimonas zhirmunskyi]MDQ2093087.1 GNAT family N-acetyltransferase [Rhodoalgimonas zhirmunskyi]